MRPPKLPAIVQAEHFARECEQDIETSLCASARHAFQQEGIALRRKDMQIEEIAACRQLCCTDHGRGHCHFKRLAMRCRMVPATGAQTRRKTRLPLVPPKPNELLNTEVIGILRAVFGT